MNETIATARLGADGVLRRCHADGTTEVMVVTQPGPWDDAAVLADLTSSRTHPWMTGTLHGSAKRDIRCSCIAHIGSMMFLARRSAWTFETSGSVGAGYGIYAAEAGELKLKDPSGRSVTFKYGGAGVGPGIGVKLPKAVNRLLKDFLQRELSGSVGPLSFNSSGSVYITPWCNKPELTIDDLTGGCIFGEINIALLKSRTAAIFLLGMNLSSLIKLVADQIPDMSDIMAAPPHAILLAKGTGLGVGIGADLFAGGVTSA